MTLLVLSIIHFGMKFIGTGNHRHIITLLSFILTMVTLLYSVTQTTGAVLLSVVILVTVVGRYLVNITVLIDRLFKY